MTYIIGDVHGEYKTLIKLINLIPKKSRIIFVGDIVDRGLSSKDVIKYIKKNKFESVMGNHEYMMVKALDNIFSKKLDTYFYNYSWFYKGGKETLASYGIAPYSHQNELDKKQKETLKEDLEFLKSMPLYLELGIIKNKLPVVVSHAFVGDAWPKKDEKILFEDIALWNREDRAKKPNIFNVFGHTPLKDVLVTDDLINVDTGCVYGKKLSAYCVESGEILSVKKQ